MQRTSRGGGDFGICLMTVHSSGAHRSVASDTEAESSEGTAAAAVAVWSLLPRERLETSRGGLWEPAHGLVRGPCLCTVPSFRCSWRVALQTPQTPFDLYATCQRSQERGCDSELHWLGMAPARCRSAPVLAHLYSQQPNSTATQINHQNSKRREIQHGSINQSFICIVNE